MWHTPRGEWVLRGAEARLIRASLRSLLRIVDEYPDAVDDSPRFGVPLFDELEKTQRLMLLSQIGAALFREDVAPMRLTAVVESTVYALYQNVMDEIEQEIELQGEAGVAQRRRWRRMVLAACREVGLDLPPDERFDDVQEWLTLPDISCTDLSAWNDEVMALSDLVLGDRDWELADELIDQPPEVAENLKSHLGIEGDYFTAVVPLPKVAELLHARKSLREIVRARPR